MTPKRQPVVWVVEMWDPRLELWEPCASADEYRPRALQELRDFKQRNPDDRFRVAKYRREGR